METTDENNDSINNTSLNGLTNICNEMPLSTKATLWDPYMNGYSPTPYIKWEVNDNNTNPYLTLTGTDGIAVNAGTDGIAVYAGTCITSNTFSNQLNVDQDKFLEDVLITLSPLRSIKLPASFSIDTVSLIDIITEIRDNGGYSNGERILLNQLRTWYRDQTRGAVSFYKMFQEVVMNNY
jgi:hypothetical protein